MTLQRVSSGDISIRKPVACLIIPLAYIALLAGCAKPFDRPGVLLDQESAQVRGQALFKKTLVSHGAENLTGLQNYNIALSGNWRRLITKIQPLVTDFTYRVASEERLLVGEGVYSAHYTGPAGHKTVVRTPDTIRVFYNDAESFDEKVLASTALTADAFYLFLLGPLALVDSNSQFIALSDKHENGRDYHRVYTELKPGFGFSSRDEIILWIDKITGLTFRVHITLEGYESTRGAHADVTYLDYQSRDGLVFPSVFNERVRGPIAINAHAWSLHGLDLNRPYGIDELDKASWTGAAALDASPFTSEQD